MMALMNWLVRHLVLLVLLPNSNVRKLANVYRRVSFAMALQNVLMVQMKVIVQLLPLQRRRLLVLVTESITLAPMHAKSHANI